MGKSSKSKGKKFAKQERAMHLKNVEVWEENMSTIDKKIDSTLGGLTTNGKKRERIGLLEEQLQLTLNIEESFAFINRYQTYKIELSSLCSLLMLEQLLSANFIQATDVYNNMAKYPLTEVLRSGMDPFSNLLLLWTEGVNVHRKKDTIAKKTAQYALDIIRRPGDIDLFFVVFVEKFLIGLSRLQHFSRVECLSLEMLRKTAGIKNEYRKKWMSIARTSLVFSYFDKMRFSKGKRRPQTLLEEVRKLRPLYNKLPFSTGYLADSLLNFYTLVYEKKEHSSGEKNTFADKCIESLERCISSRSRDAQILCHACHDEDTPYHEGLVCQGCRVVSYCCKYHQRLNYVHHEETGTRGLGHKQLCPVFKAYRRKIDNIDTSKQGHLDRKFQRACKRFLRGTLENNLHARYDPVGGI